ncbi:flagellar basal body-associated protein FliL [Dongshaea marina]|uniref:flagellar basal body-associated protein FliL n=1 Tax=Dongshaea marina TaxID=2047966 RepID=UPI001F3A0A87|nr:flagellar basal body-associated protein FliL [Dongshaea marina]
MLIIIIAVVVILVGGGAAAWFLLFSGSDSGEAVQTEEVVEEPITSSEAVYVGMPRPFVFNVAGTPRDRLVQIKVQLLVRGTENEAFAKQHVPLIEGTLLRVFSAETAAQLETLQGKDQLRQKSLDEVRKSLEKLTGVPVVEKVLFTGFVMQ